MDTLVLNADGQPISMLPPSTIQWKEAITYLWLDKVNVLEWYDDWVVHSERWETKVPAVIILSKEMARRGKSLVSQNITFTSVIYSHANTAQLNSLKLN